MQINENIAPLLEPSDHRTVSAKKALWLSFIPGGGQIYNRKYWKLPIVYGGLGFTIYTLTTNKKIYRELDQAYTYRFDDDPATIDVVYSQYSDASIIANRKTFDKNVQLSYIWTGIIYGLSMADAFVDAHLSEFNVTDDLNLSVKPTTLDGQGLGISLSLELGAK